MGERMRMLPKVPGNETREFINGQIYQYGSCENWRRHMRAKSRVNTLYDAFENGEINREELIHRAFEVGHNLHGTYNTVMGTIQERNKQTHK